PRCSPRLLRPAITFSTFKRNQPRRFAVLVKFGQVPATVRETRRCRFYVGQLIREIVCPKNPYLGAGAADRRDYLVHETRRSGRRLASDGVTRPFAYATALATRRRHVHSPTLTAQFISGKRNEPSSVSQQG